MLLVLWVKHPQGVQVADVWYKHQFVASVNSHYDFLLDFKLRMYYCKNIVQLKNWKKMWWDKIMQKVLDIMIIMIMGNLEASTNSNLNVKKIKPQIVINLFMKKEECIVLSYCANMFNDYSICKQLCLWVRKTWLIWFYI